MNIRGVPQALSLFGDSTTFWGVPADKNGSGLTRAPFISMPTACLGPLATTMRADSWGNPGEFKTESFLSHDGVRVITQTSPDPITGIPQV